MRALPQVRDRGSSAGNLRRGTQGVVRLGAAEPEIVTLAASSGTLLDVYPRSRRRAAREQRRDQK